MSNWIERSAQMLKAQIDSLMAAYPELAEDEEFRADVIEGETDLNDIIAKAVSYHADAKTMVEAIKSRQADLEERRARFERRSDAMRELIKGLMEAARRPNLTLPEATLGISAGRDSVQIDDVDALPQGYYRVKKEPDKTAIKKAFGAGETIPGASIVTGEPTLTIRTK